MIVFQKKEDSFSPHIFFPKFPTSFHFIFFPSMQTSSFMHSFPGLRERLTVCRGFQVKSFFNKNENAETEMFVKDSLQTLTFFSVQLNLN